MPAAKKAPPPVSFRLSDEDKDRFQAAAEAEGVAFSDFVRSALAEKVEGSGDAVAGAVEIPLAWIAGPYLYQEGPRAGQVMNPRTRFPADKQEELRESLRINGQVDACKVHVPAGSPPASAWTDAAHPEIRMVDGHRRLMEATAAGLTTLRCEVDTYTDAGARAVARITGTDRENLSEMDRIRSYRIDWEEAQEAGITQAALAARLGYKAQSTLSNDLRLLDLPPSVLDLIDDGVIDKSSAKNSLLPFLAVPQSVDDVPALPDAARAAMVAELLPALRDAQAANPTQPVPGPRVREIVAQVAVSMSFPIVSGTGAGTDPRPLFEVAEHDQECECSAPSFKYLSHLPEHRRCFVIAWWQAKQKEVREQMEAAQRERMVQARTQVQAEAGNAAPAPAVTPARAPRSDSVEARAGENAGASALTGDDDVTDLLRAPGQASPRTSQPVAAPATPAAVLPPYERGQVLTADERAAHDPAGEWACVGTVDAAGFPQAVAGAAGVYRDVAAMDLEGLRYVSDGVGGVEVWWTPGSLAAGAEASEMVLAEAREAKGRQFADDLRRPAADLKTSDPAFLAALLAGQGRVSGSFLPLLAGAIGIEVPVGMDPATAIRTLTSLPRGELEMLAKVASHVHANDLLNHLYGRPTWITNQARAAVAEACARSLADVVKRVPPRLDAGDEARQVYTRLEAALQRARSAARATPVPADLPALLTALRTARAEAGAFQADGGKAPVGCDLDAMLVDVGEFVTGHPGVLQSMDPRERLECRLGSLRATLDNGVQVLAEARTGDREAKADLPGFVERVEQMSVAAWEDVSAGAHLPAGGDEVALLDRAAAFVAEVQGEEATLFGELAVPEPVGALGAAPGEENPLSQHAAKLAGDIRAAQGAAETRGMTDEDEAHARRVLERHVKVGFDFLNANRESDGADFSGLIDALEAAEAMLAGPEEAA